MSLYLKYRPRTIDELDLTSVREALLSIVKSNQVSHAYLFTGPRGAGKTSSARILSRIVNCEKNKDKLGEPCNECAACRSILSGSSLDFVEIDAASNRGIDDIRELKERIKLAPTELKYKIYIIDEVHMLTTEAFNALLKTLEEPPAHTIFVLCTTETHKIPQTIMSRCSRVMFSKANKQELVRSLSRVLSGEGKKVETSALEYLATSVDGSFRDGVKILEKVLQTEGEIDLSTMKKAVTGSSNYEVKPLVLALIEKDQGRALELAITAFEQGVDLSYLLISLMKELTARLVDGADIGLTKIIFSLDEVARKLATSPVPELLIQVVIVEWCGGDKKPGRSEDRKIGNPETRNTRNPEVQKPGSHVEPVKQVKPENQNYQGSHTDLWAKLLKSLNGDSITMGALLSKARPAKLAGDTLTISVAYGFHREQIMSERVLAKLEKAVEKVVGRRIRVVCEVDSSSEHTQEIADETSNQDDTIDEAMAIFS